MPLIAAVGGVVDVGTVFGRSGAVAVPLRAPTAQEAVLASFCNNRARVLTPGCRPVVAFRAGDAPSALNDVSAGGFCFVGATCRPRTTWCHTRAGQHTKMVNRHPTTSINISWTARRTDGLVNLVGFEVTARHPAPLPDTTLSAMPCWCSCFRVVTPAPNPDRPVAPTLL